MNPKETKYRSDVDGLRAVAVLSVVLYHFGLESLQGGFIGVDVFFVISGFLIAGIINTEIQQDSFTFAGFYERRVRRIFPALFVMLVVVAASGYFILLPTDFVLLAKGTLSTLAFGSNIFFWRNSGYFDSVSELNPLLHTWSLAVEEQFYFAFPVFLVVAARYSRTLIKPMLWGLVVLSLIACVAQQTHRPTATFYLSPFRAWELGIGALLALGAIPRIKAPAVRELAALSGLALVLGAAFLLQAGDSFPGWRAIFPVLGAALILHAGLDGSTWVSRLLSRRPLVLVGLISYSLYLWHWPVKVYASYLGGLAPLGWRALPLLAFTMLISYLSYRWVEQPIRRQQALWAMKRRTVLVGSALASGGLALLVVPVLLTHGLPARLAPDLVSLDNFRRQEVAFRPCFGLGAAAMSDQRCRIGAPQIPPSVLLLGDSHSASIAPAVDWVLQQGHRAGVVMPSSSCPPFVRVGNRKVSECFSSNEDAFEIIDKNPDIKLVILHAFWIAYTGRDPENIDITKVIFSRSVQGVEMDLSFASDLQRTIDYITARGKQVLIIGPMTESPMSPTEIVFAKLSGKTLSPPFKKDFFEQQKADRFDLAISNITTAGVRVIHPSRFLCRTGACEYLGVDYPIFRDRNHLSLRGARYLADYLATEIH